MGKQIFVEGPELRRLRAATLEQAVEPASLPETVVIPIGEMELLVAVGETVQTGQMLAHSAALLTAPVHASITGKVTTVDRHLLPGGGRSRAVTIVSDGTGSVHSSVRAPENLAAMPASEVRDRLFAAGIPLPLLSGGKMGPVIVNCAETEPSLTADYRLVVERAPELVLGLQAMMQAWEVPGYIYVDRRESQAAEAVGKALLPENGITLLTGDNRYPAAARHLLLRDVLGGKESKEALVVNVTAALAAAEVMRTGMPLIEKVVTVTGSCVKTPKNLQVRIGTRFSEILTACGAEGEVLGQVITGGPLTGRLVGSLDVPVTREVTGIVALVKADVQTEEAAHCVRCGSCVRVCPVNLMPLYLGDLVAAKRVPETAGYHLADCIECGACAYECPAKRPLLQYIQLAKAELAQ